MLDDLDTLRARERLLDRVRSARLAVASVVAEFEDEPDRFHRDLRIEFAVFLKDFAVALNSGHGRPNGKQR